MTAASGPLTIESLRAQLIQLVPELDSALQSLPDNNPEYERITALPLQLIDFLSDGSEENIVAACKAYIAFCNTFMEKQLEFVRSRRNPDRTYAETDFNQVNNNVYQNARYMSQVYYPALLLSYLFSSNYFAIYRNFCESFIPMVAGRSGASLEVGIGHGLLSASMLNANRDRIGYGMDISPVSPEISGRVSSFFKLVPPIVTRVADATSHIPLENGLPYQVMICAEVLEHLPDPAKLLRNMHGALSQDGILFLTASINMESVDHLYLFRSDDEVVQMVEQSGFKPITREYAFLTTQRYRDDPDKIEYLKKMRSPATAILIAAKC